MIYATQLSYTKRRVDFPPVSQFAFILSPFSFRGYHFVLNIWNLFRNVMRFVVAGIEYTLFHIRIENVCVWIPFFFIPVCFLVVLGHVMC